LDFATFSLKRADNHAHRHSLERRRGKRRYLKLTESGFRNLFRATWIVPVAIGLWGAVGVVSVMARRMGYPFELEWMEGGVLIHVQRVLEGKPLYVEPAPEFMPFLYAPGYYYFNALIAKGAGLSLFSLRLVSALSTGVIAALIFVLIRAEGASVLVSCIGPLLFLDTFALSGAWFDLARVDSFALALALGSLVAARRATSNVGLIAAGALAAFATLTKQSSLAVLPASVAWVWMRRGRRGAAIALGAFAVTLLVPASLLAARSHGWVWYYLIELPSTHGMKGREGLVTAFWRDEIAQPLPVAMTCALLFSFGLPLAIDRRNRILHGAFLTLFVVDAYVARLHMGSSLNDLMPAHAALAVVFGLTLHGIVGNAGQNGARVSRNVVAAVLAAAQFALLIGDLG
jgi:4-amino-4-deoxy-L-arabinose transferase-like glycosyltransferase